MRKSHRVAAILALACLGPAAAIAQRASSDPFSRAPKGRLYLTIELKGAGRKDLPNKVEWYRLTAYRKLVLELAMLVPTKSPVPFVKVGGIDKDNAPRPAGMAAIAKALEACKGEETCQRQAMMAIGQQMMANPQAMGSMQQDDTRFENWVADQRGPCVKGTLVVEDAGDGMNISPPAPAKPYSFKRTGRLTLPNESQGAMEKACQAEISVDRQKGLLSLRLNDLSIPIPVQMTGAAFAPDKSVAFLEGRPKLELFDQKVDPDAKTWTGQGTFEKVGTASHNSGQTVAPMAATLTWRFVRD